MRTPVAYCRSWQRFLDKTLFPLRAFNALTPNVRHVFENPASAEQIRAFQAWERRNAKAMYLRYEDFPVDIAFGLRPSDVVTVNSDMELSFEAEEAHLFDVDRRYIGKFVGVPSSLLQSFLASLDGERRLKDILSTPPFETHTDSLERLVGSLLGQLFLVPAAVDALEAQLPAIELLRFPGQSPYAMPRQYWENSVAVRGALDTFYQRLPDVKAFSDGLRGLHRLATIGADGRTYYGGAGGIPTIPGEYRTTPIENRFSERKKWILSTWMQLLDWTISIADNGTIVSHGGFPLLQLVERGTKCRHLYGTRGEYLELQVNDIRVHLANTMSALEAGNPDEVLHHCALLHHAFAHAHPFNNINNSIAMNIVNDLLQKAGLGVLPHLYFDQVAYFMQPNDYVDFCKIAVRAHIMNDELGCDRPLTIKLLDAIQQTPEVAASK